MLKHIVQIKKKNYDANKSKIKHQHCLTIVFTFLINAQHKLTLIFQLPYRSSVPIRAPRPKPFIHLEVDDNDDDDDDDDDEDDNDDDDDGDANHDDDIRPPPKGDRSEGTF